MSTAGEIAALLDERAGYLVYGRKGRADQVTEELARLGYVDDIETVKASPVEEAGGGSARGRSGRRG